VVAPRKSDPPADGPDSTMKIRTRPDREGLSAGEPPSQSGLIVLALGGLALAIAAVVMFFKMRGSVTAPDAAPKFDVPFYMIPDAAIVDAAPTPIDVAIEIDAAPPAVDAGTKPSRDAGVKPIDIDAAVARPSGTGAVKIGAEPWGDIIIDGTPKGRTPATLTLPAGKHTIEVIFGGEDPPRTKTFVVDVTNGVTESRFADFTK
jgi:hypothetical protein